MISAVARQGKISDQALIQLFLDMIVAERGGAKNTVAAYARDLEDFSGALAAIGRHCGLGYAGYSNDYAPSRTLPHGWWGGDREC